MFLMKQALVILWLVGFFSTIFASLTLRADCVAAPAGLVGWWPGEGNARNIAGTNDGVPQNLNYAGGEAGQAFVFDGYSSMVQIPAGPNLDAGQGAGLTIEAWINPASLNLQALFEWNQNNGVPYGAAQIGVHLEIDESPGDGSLWGNVVDTGGISHNLNSATGIIATNQFQHVALTYDKASGAACLYCNGSLVATNNLGTFTPQTSFDLFLGNRPSGFFAGDYFQGEIDEPSLYNRALSADEIAAIYNAGSNGKCTASTPPEIVSQPASQAVTESGTASFSVTAYGSVPLQYQWKFNAAAIPAATNATLTLTNVHPNQAGNYTVTVTNPYGSATSSNAQLAVATQTILVFDYSGNDKITAKGREFSQLYKGSFFFIPDTTNGVFVGWGNIGGQKQYWLAPFEDYVWAAVPGSTGHVYSVIGKGGASFDPSGHPHIWGFFHKGLNTTLSVSWSKKISFPNKLAYDGIHVYPDPQTGSLILSEAQSAFTFSSAATQNANNTGETLVDLVNAQVALLIKQGYSRQP